MGAVKVQRGGTKLRESGVLQQRFRASSDARGDAIHFCGTEGVCCKQARTISGCKQAHTISAPQQKRRPCQAVRTSERVLYQVATLVSHCAVNAAGWRRLRSTPSPSRLLVAAPGPALCSAMPRSLVMLVRVRVSPVPACVRPRRPSAKPTTYGAIHAAGWGGRAARCCDGAGDAASCTRSRRAGVALQPRGASAPPASWLVAGSTPAPGGPESCWLPLCSQHSAKLAGWVVATYKTARRASCMRWESQKARCGCRWSLAPS